MPVSDQEQKSLLCNKAFPATVLFQVLPLLDVPGGSMSGSLRILVGCAFILPT